MVCVTLSYYTLWKYYSEHTHILFTYISRNFYKETLISKLLERERKGKKRLKIYLSQYNKMAKLKSLMPSLKEKKRFLVFEVISEKPIKEFKEINRAIWDKSNEFLGKLETAKSGLWTLADKWNDETQKGILKVNNLYVDKIKAVFALMGKDKFIIRSVGASGILKKAQSKFLN